MRRVEKVWQALSVVAPAGERIATGAKTIEVRRWQPPLVPLRDLVIVQNNQYLLADGQIDEHGEAVALVDVIAVEPWTEAQVAAACCDGWEAGFYAWRIENVRPISPAVPAVAKRKIYDLPMDGLP